MDAEIFQILRCTAEFLPLMALPHVRLHHADAGQILLHAGIEPVVSFEHLVKERKRPGDNKGQHASEKDQRRQKDQRQSGTDRHAHEQGRNHHDRRPHEHADNHLERVLYVGHVGGHTGHQARRGKVVNILERKILNVVIHGLAQVPSEAHGRPGCEHSRQGARQKGEHGDDEHDNAQLHHIVHISGLHSAVDDRSHQNRQQDLQNHFQDHAARSKRRISLKFSDIGCQSFNHILPPQVLPLFSGYTRTRAFAPLRSASG